ncbi:hypothetical protein BGZ61DRAFT_58070 [Ilyonectria robusta]|uniref:uncharacterized protein n=1 Tax=Ilyonectria robusta TaxID=1079257 RepID=UPI001E8D482F|nr:uncharacterized protein BGZ61DRAFT_58070 [Ilyonectria robusta]KAH8685330.1 hypothetical protein BGZ61DRAFT_58070 [Ilyonectria robusta]
MGWGALGCLERAFTLISLLLHHLSSLHLDKDRITVQELLWCWKLHPVLTSPSTSDEGFYLEAAQCTLRGRQIYRCMHHTKGISVLSFVFVFMAGHHLFQGLGAFEEIPHSFELGVLEDKI